LVERFGALAQLESAKRLQPGANPISPAIEGQVQGQGATHHVRGAASLDDFLIVDGIHVNFQGCLLWPPSPHVQVAHLR
jgi:hypothetical protein